MERIFLSYTYNPVDEFKQDTEEFIKYLKIMLESMGMQVSDGVDVGGRAIDSEIEKRIEASDALIAVMTPWQDAHGQSVIPPYVQTEYNIAHTQNKHTIRIIHDFLAVQGMFSNNEYIPYSTANDIKVILKLMRIISLWKQESGNNIQIKIEPPDLGARFDEHQHGHRFEYQLLVNYTPTGWKDAKIWNEPGATFAYIPNVPEESKLQLRLQLGNELWDSPFTSSMGQIKLQKKGVT